MYLKTYRISLFILCGFLWYSTAAQVKNVKHADLQWIQYYNQLTLTERWTLMTDGGFRWENWSRNNGLYIARIGAGYQLNSALRVAAGMASTGTYGNSGLSRLELRPYQELFASYAYNKINIQHRFRVEERYFKNVIDGDVLSGHTFHFRLRYQISATIPLVKFSATPNSKQLFLNVADEIFVNAGKEVVYNMLDKNRFIIGPVFQFNKALTVGLLYTHQYSQLNIPATYSHGDVMWLVVRHSIHLAKSKLES